VTGPPGNRQRYLLDVQYYETAPVQGKPKAMHLDPIEGYVENLDHLPEMVDYFRQLVTSELRSLSVFRGLSFRQFQNLRFAIQIQVGTFHPISVANQRIREINLNTILELVEKLTQSARVEVDLGDITLGVLFPRNMFAFGGSVKPSVQDWFPNNIKKSPSAKSLSDSHGPISCLAVALAQHLRRLNSVTPQNARSEERAVTLMARQLQTEMGWGQLCGLDDLNTFVEKYPHLRIGYFKNVKKSQPVMYYHPSFETFENRKTIYVYLGSNSDGTGHWFTIPQPLHFIKTRDRGEGGGIRFCDECCNHYGEHSLHLCESAPTPRKNSPYCQNCYVRGHWASKCDKTKCKQCNRAFQNGDDHRCSLTSRNFKNGECFDNEQWAVAPFQRDGCTDGALPALLVWDIESQLDIVSSATAPMAEKDENGNCTGQMVEAAQKVRSHRPIFVGLANVFSNEEWKFKGHDCIKNMFTFLQTYNGGQAILLAHNASKYDNRFIYDAFCRDPEIAKDLGLITRGNKFLQISYKYEIIFRDSLLHIPGSLKNLAKSYGLSADMQKGYFPHLFNISANYNYVGPKPDKEYFDLPANDANFNEWYNTLPEIYNFKEELEKYGMQDVRVLREIVKIHDEKCRAINRPLVRSPWQYCTAPSYAHDTLVLAYNQMLEDEVSARSHGDKILGNQIRSEIVRDRGWPILMDEEYLFARRALHGGRTNLVRAYYNAESNDGKLGYFI
jgi:hypothetical protein